jgi:tellurite resistance protein
MPVSGETGGKLAEMIKKAIDDGKITNLEYDQILMLADADGVIDAQEKRLLGQLQDLLANKTVVRVPD